MDASASGLPGVSLPVLGGRGGFIPGDEHPCAKCASIQRTCCQRAEVVVTVGDVARISRHVGREDFHHLRTPSDQAYSQQDDDPNWARYVFDDHGRRDVLLRLEDGACMFLGDRGCVLPTEVRPLVCRLYPFTYTESGITGVEGEYCPVERVAPPRQGLIEALGMRLEDAIAWRATLYEELRTKREWDDHRPYVRSA